MGTGGATYDYSGHLTARQIPPVARSVLKGRSRSCQFLAPCSARPLFSALQCQSSESFVGFGHGVATYCRLNPPRSANFLQPLFPPRTGTLAQLSVHKAWRDVELLTPRGAAAAAGCARWLLPLRRCESLLPSSSW
jgi:hypothetical protein